MPIKPVSAEQIEQAAEEFDRDLRSTSGWENWQHKGNQRYALKWRNKLYPPKTIIALATGQKVQTFSGGSEANEYLASRDFEIQTIGLPSETEVKIALHELLLSRDSHEITPAEAYA